MLISKELLTEEERDIIVGMSINEGNLDSVQSYDSEIITVGAMQKTINSNGFGQFPIQMKEFRDEYVGKFKQLFEDCGWTVKLVEAEIMRDNKKRKVTEWRAYYKGITGVDLKNTKPTLKELIRNSFTKDTLGKKIQCIPIEPLINATTDPDFQVKQIKDFVTELHKVLEKIPSGHLYPLKVYLKSKLGKALALDHQVNRPGYVINDFGKALNKFYNNPKYSEVSKNPSDWKGNHKTYENEIIGYYADVRRGTHMGNGEGRDKNERYKRLLNRQSLK
jgi:hypothetical protein